MHQDSGCISMEFLVGHASLLLWNASDVPQKVRSWAIALLSLEDVTNSVTQIGT